MSKTYVEFYTVNANGQRVYDHRTLDCSFSEVKRILENEYRKAVVVTDMKSV